MANIKVLDQNTIDQIAAGEVIERPSAVVKELVENAIDAGATAVTVEIKDGGVTFIRITDNGKGIEKGEVSTAFLRHATSKIRTPEDLVGVSSLGFRGEALSSIASIAQVELITKTAGDFCGTRYTIEGGQEKDLEEIGAPEGTTFLVRNLFYNTPARRKFLKSPGTEAGYISDIMERLALSHPDVSFKFINQNQTKLHTSGNANVKDMIYQIYGRDIAANLIEVNAGQEGMKLKGFIGKPTVSRGNRNYENYFVNYRYVKSSLIAKGIEDAYKTYMMQHKYPFVVLYFEIDGDYIDVNVHPSKLELRFQNQEQVYQFISHTLKEGLIEKELIPKVTLDDKKEKEQSVPSKPDITFSLDEKKSAPKFSKQVIADSPKKPETMASIAPARTAEPQENDLQFFMSEMKKRVEDYHQPEVEKPSVVKEDSAYGERKPETPVPESPKQVEEEQLNLFEEKLLTKASKAEHHIIGQVFDTYWLVEFQEKLFIIDQHAAHEKVLYEKMMKQLKEKEHTSQMIDPPIILTLSMQEETLLSRYLEYFQSLGFEIEPFGGKEYAVRAVPDNLFSIAKKDLLIELIDQLGESGANQTADLITEKVASMSCKAAIKGSHAYSRSEAEALIGELLELENPYNCPHGRPTIISMTKRELEKKFKRIV